MTTQNLWLKLAIVLGLAVLAASCETPLSQFEVQRPARLTIPKTVTRIYIKTSDIKGVNDQLGIKTQVLERLKNELNRFGRFQVSVVNEIPEGELDREKESFAVIQGEVISGGEVDRGQLTETATCKGGIAGRLGAVVAGAATEAPITLDSHAFVCKTGDLKTAIVEGVASKGFAMALAAATGEKAPAETPMDDVIRVYHYKNVSLFAQTNFSFTIIGLQRETMAIRADAASFGRHVIDKDSYRNVAEGRPNPLIQGIMDAFRLPVIPITVRNAGVITETVPASDFYSAKPLPKPTVDDILPREKEAVIQQLVDSTLIDFIRTISPYKAMISTEIASGGKADVSQLLKSSRWQDARAKIEKIGQDQRSAADWYNLGLTYEGGAESTADYEDARQFYVNALEKDSGNKLFAMGVGRVERRLAESKLLKVQTDSK
ncbi:hypothetical protein WDW89_03075 [Deltaproteobacteria bacterium TL4]